MKPSLLLPCTLLLALVACAPVPPPQSEQPKEEIEEVEEIPSSASSPAEASEDREATEGREEIEEEDSKEVPRPSEPPYQSSFDGAQDSGTGQAEPESQPQPRVIEVEFSNWQFSPSTIRVKKGEDVTLQLVGTEGNHGFAVPGMGINQTMSQGATATVKLRTSEPGTFQFFCSVPCGAGHKDMRGTIVVE